MRIHCYSMVRNEADVLGFTLDAALAWADSIHVCDNGSTDGTLELIQEYSANYPDIVSCHQVLEPFSEALRVEGVRRLWDRAAEGDWWCLLDADEVYVNDPRVFLKGVGRKYGKVESASIQFYLTEHDVARFDAGERDWRPEHATHYLMNWSEARFVRHQPSVPWTGRWPENMRWLYPAPERIRLLHYQYRTPWQVNRRIRSRHKTPSSFQHEIADVWVPRGLTAADVHRSDLPVSPEELWKTRVVKAEALRRYDPKHPPEVDERLLPPLPQPNRGLTRIRRGMTRRIKSLLRPLFPSS
jgi:glycosyltransferase involved in cell wall biosynthesis